MKVGGKLEGNLSHGVLEGLAHLELHHRASGDGDILAGVLGVAAYLGLDFLDLESTEIANDNAVTLAQSVCDDFHGFLYNFQNFILRETGAEVGANLVDEFAFGNSICHKCCVVERVVEREYS